MVESDDFQIMKCNQIIDDLELFVLDGIDAGLRDGVVEHLRDCAACRERVEALNGTLGMLKSCATLPGTPIDHRQYHQRAFAEIAAVRARARWTFILAKAAAAVILCGGAGLLMLHYLGGGLDRCLCKPWEQTGMHAMNAPDSAYPLVRGSKVFDLKDTPAGLHLTAFDKRSGKPLWETPYAVDSAFDSDGQHLVVWMISSGNAHTLVVIGPDTGKTIWTHPSGAATEGVRLSRPVLLKGGVCWLDGASVNFVDASTGALLWSTVLEQTGQMSLPAADAKNIYVASAQTLYAFDGKTGKLVWQHRYESDAPLFGRTAMISTDSGKVLVLRGGLTQSGMLYCHDAEAGHVAWSKPSAASLSMLASGGKVFVRSGLIEAFDLANGSLLWSVKEAGCSPLTIEDNRIYVVAGQDKRRIATFNVNTGKPIKAFNLPSSCSGIAVQGQRGFLNSREGILYSVVLDNNTRS